ncbi:MAG: hypothetical protein KKG59_06385 [Nanoarchaeota archaeon]|nr:hypothetical protein [Nanoarchaeota archaeon]
MKPNERSQEGVVNAFAKALTDEIRNVKLSFYETFEATKTGNNHTHARTMGYIVRALIRLYPEYIIEIEPHLSMHVNGKIKLWRPDILVRKGDVAWMIIDYESPNSSDARIECKDVNQYRASGLAVPYIIITTLPNKLTPSWELRYTTKGYRNEEHKGKREEVRQNPYTYWYSIYKETFRNKYLTNIFFLNINGHQVQRELNELISQ